MDGGHQEDGVLPCVPRAEDPTTEDCSPPSLPGTQLPRIVDAMNQTLGTILLVGDEPPERIAFRTILAGRGYPIIEAGRGLEALAVLRSLHVDLVFLNAQLTGLSGVDTCIRIRKEFPSLPIIMFSENSNEDSVVRALNAGADDFIKLPVQLGELFARVRATMRRNLCLPTDPGTVTAGDLRLDPSVKLLEKQGKSIHLTRRQCEILQFLMTNCDKPIGHEELLNTIWGKNCTDRVDYLRTFVRQIRMRIEDNPSRPRYLLTEQNFGYRFTVPAT